MFFALISFNLYFQLHCCGIEGPDDWKLVYHNDTLPETCCDDNVCEYSEIHHTGCLKLLQTEVENYALIIGGVGIGVACIQVNNFKSVKWLNSGGKLV